MDDQVLRLKEAARVAGVALGTITRGVKDGSLPVYERPSDRRSRFVMRSDLDQFLGLRRVAVKASADQEEAIAA